MKKRLFFSCLLLLTVLLACPSAVKAQNVETIDSLITDEIYMIKGDLVTLSVNLLTRLSLTDPDAVDIIDADEEEVLLIAQEPGQSSLFIWDSDGKRTITIFVAEEDLVQIQRRIKELLKTADITTVRTKINEEEGKIVLVGEVHKDVRGKFETATDDFLNSIIDLTTEEEIRDLIEINMQISEISTSSLKNLGIEWQDGGASDLTITYEETLPEFDGSFGDYFKLGDFKRVESLSFIVNALEVEGQARTLARPKLLVVNGEEASFLVGGEIPIRSSTSAEGATLENVEFKDYGISMTLTPVIKNEKIEIDLTVEDSDIDSANSFGGDVAFVTRTAQTMLLLNDGQTIVLAGFIRKARSELLRKVPFLSNVPIFGALFRNRSTPSGNSDTELIITLTPKIVEKNRTRNVLMASENKMDTGFVKRSTGQVNPSHISGIPQDMTRYIQKIQEKISRSILYPQEAKSHGWEGTVKVGMLILNDGTLAYALVKGSSGHDVFDEFALDKARESAPFEPFPAGTDLRELNVTIPIVYSLNN